MSAKRIRARDFPVTNCHNHMTITRFTGVYFSPFWDTSVALFRKTTLKRGKDILSRQEGSANQLWLETANLLLIR